MKKLLLLSSLLITAPCFAEAPRLVLQITVDGLRADLLDRYRENFVKDGFNYLRNNDWGFWHLKQFSADYRKQFGELPSQTLQA